MTSTANLSQLPAETKCFRLRRHYLLSGVVCAVVFAVIGVASTLLAYWDPDGSARQPKLAALMFGIFWSGWTLLSVWGGIMAYFRERLFLAPTMVRQLGIFRSRAVDFGNVIQINWRRWPVGGSIVVRTPSEKVTIYLDKFTTEEREELTRFFREKFANEIQENWSRFEDCARKLSPAQWRASRGGIIVTASVLTCFAPIFFYCWFSGAGVRYLLFGVAAAVAALFNDWRLWTFKDRSVAEEEATTQKRLEC